MEEEEVEVEVENVSGCIEMENHKYKPIER